MGTFAGEASAASSAARAPVVVPEALPPTACFAVPGAYLRSDVTDITSESTDEIVLHSDGTAFWNQASAAAFINSAGTFTPGIGAWTCGPDDTVVVTAVSFESDNGDSDLTRSVRVTYQMKFDRNDPEHPLVVHRTIIKFDLPGSLPTGNTLDPNGGTVASVPLTAPRHFARVQVLLSDLSR